jgi:glucose/mannose-6-phosphate isomerase
LSSSLSRQAIEAIDSLGMLNDVLDQPHQLADALWRVEAAGIEPSYSPRGLVICGVGGSAIGGDLAQAALGGRARSQIRTVRDYEPGFLIDEQTLVVCASYSGETEETLACFEAAGACNARRIVATTGGALAKLARKAGVPVIGVPSGLQPRAAIVYMMVVAMECAALCGAAPRLADEIAGASDLLASLCREWGPDSSEDSLAKELARELEGTIPLIYGASLTVPVARRLKAQINENAKTPAFYASLPEANHNELCGWEGSSRLAPLFALFLTDRDTHPRSLERIELSAKYAGRAAKGVRSIASLGETRVERVLSLVLLGDLVAVYLAVLDGVDPGPVEPIVNFKRELT